MPSIGNGQLATGVYTDTVYMNGLYNGELGESHRARIPSQINIRMSVGANQTMTDCFFVQGCLSNGMWLMALSWNKGHLLIV